MIPEKEMINRICFFLENLKNTHGYSYGELEKKSKITKTMIHSLEGKKGLNVNPTVKTLRKILGCYNLTLLDLFKYVYKENEK